MRTCEFVEFYSSEKSAPINGSSWCEEAAAKGCLDSLQLVCATWAVPGVGSAVNVPTFIFTLIKLQFRSGAGETRRMVLYWTYEFIDKMTCYCDIHARTRVTTPSVFNWE